MKERKNEERDKNLARIVSPDETAGSALASLVNDMTNETKVHKQEQQTAEEYTPPAHQLLARREPRN